MKYLRWIASAALFSLVLGTSSFALGKHDPVDKKHQKAEKKQLQRHEKSEKETLKQHQKAEKEVLKGQPASGSAHRALAAHQRDEKSTLKSHQKLEKKTLKRHQKSERR